MAADVSVSQTRAASGTSLLALLAAVTAVGAITLNIYLPARPAVQAYFHTTTGSTGLTISLAGLAFACGLLAYGPFSDRYGRRPAIMVGLALFIAGTTVSLCAISMPMLIAGRILQALGSSAGVTVGRAVVRDRWPPKDIARNLAYLTMVVAVANALAPSLGGLLTEVFHWRAVFAALLVASLCVMTWAALCLPETLPSSHPDTRRVSTSRTLINLLQQPSYRGYALQTAIVYATFMVFAAYMPYVMTSCMGGTPTTYGLCYLFIPAGYFSGNYAIARLSTHYGLVRLFTAGTVIQCVAALVALLFALLHYWHPIAVFGPWMFLALGQGLILPNVTAAAVSENPGAAGTASGLLGFIQQVVAAGAVQAMSGVPTNTPLPIAWLVAVATTIAMIDALYSRRGSASLIPVQS